MSGRGGRAAGDQRRRPSGAKHRPRRRDANQEQVNSPRALERHLAALRAAHVGQRQLHAGRGHGVGLLGAWGWGWREEGEVASGERRKEGRATHRAVSAVSALLLRSMALPFAMALRLLGGGRGSRAAHLDCGWRGEEGRAARRERGVRDPSLSQKGVFRPRVWLLVQGTGGLGWFSTRSGSRLGE